MNSETRYTEVVVSRSNFDAQIAQLLYATGVINDNEIVVSTDYKFLENEIYSDVKIKLALVKEVN